jgi:hypothetical protein
MSRKKEPHSGLTTAGCAVPLLFLSLLLSVYAQAREIQAEGGWTKTIDASNLVSGAGSNLTGTYESGTAATIVQIEDTGSWRVNVKHSAGTNWDSNFILYAQRTSDGSGSGTISGGFPYVEITAADAAFFSGTLNRETIHIQYKLSGMSVSVVPGTHSTTVTLTLVAGL